VHVLKGERKMCRGKCLTTPKRGDFICMAEMGGKRPEAVSVAISDNTKECIRDDNVLSPPAEDTNTRRVRKSLST
jgi:hypothetical protein